MRFCLCLLMLAAFSAFAADSLRGKLVLRDGQPPALETAEHKLVTYSGPRISDQAIS